MTGLLLLAVPRADGESLLFDFERGDLQGWKVVAGEFANPVGRYGSGKEGALKGPRQGESYLTTAGAASGRKGPTAESMGGVIESPVFVVEGEEARFLYGGTGARLTLHTLDGRKRREMSGWARGELKRQRWNLADLVGERVYLRLTDPPEKSSSSASMDAFEVEGRIDREATGKRRKELSEENRQAVAPALKALEEVGEILFAVREPGKNDHYYVNFGNWCGNPNKWEYGRGGRLCRLELRSGKVTTLLEDPRGAIRDPQVH